MGPVGPARNLHKLAVRWQRPGAATRSSRTRTKRPAEGPFCAVTHPPRRPAPRPARASYSRARAATATCAGCLSIRFPSASGAGPGSSSCCPQSVSKAHAEIYWADDGLHLRDLESTQRDLPEPPGHQGRRPARGRHPALRRLRVPPGPADRASEDSTTKARTARHRCPSATRSCPGSSCRARASCKELTAIEAVTVMFQPIVLLPKGTVVAYEALGRGRHPGLPESPRELFKIAESIGLEVELSQPLPLEGGRPRALPPGLPKLFLNTHPAELDEPGPPRFPEGAARDGSLAEPRPRDPRRRPRRPRVDRALCAASSRRSRSASPTTTSGRARPVSSSSARPRRTTSSSTCASSPESTTPPPRSGGS